MTTGPRALGLIVGGALGNLASLITSPAGVVDFIALSFESWGIVLNVADVAAYAGLAMILRTGSLIALAIRRDRRVSLVKEKHPVREVFAEKAAARHRARRQRDIEWVRRPELEVVVMNGSEVSRAATVAADAPSRDVSTTRAPTALRAEPVAPPPRP